MRMQRNGKSSLIRMIEKIFTVEDASGISLPGNVVRGQGGYFGVSARKGYQTNLFVS